MPLSDGVNLRMGTDGNKYIIVGGGTAGCVLANRLTVDKVGVVAFTFLVHG